MEKQYTHIRWQGYFGGQLPEKAQVIKNNNKKKTFTKFFFVQNRTIIFHYKEGFLMAIIHRC